MLTLPRHPDEHGPKGRVLLGVDQELGERARLEAPIVLAERESGTCSAQWRYCLTSRVGG
jgi:hypothetical protein